MAPAPGEPMAERTLVTGLGAVSPLGWGVMPLWEGLVAGRSGLGPVRRFDASAFRSAGGGEVPPREDGGPARGGTLAEGYLLEAVREALADSGAPAGGTALVVGTNFGGMAAAERALAGGGEPDLAGYEFREQAARCARELGLSGVAVALSLSCASGTAAPLCVPNRHSHSRLNSSNQSGSRATTLSAPARRGKSISGGRRRGRWPKITTSSCTW